MANAHIPTRVRDVISAVADAHRISVDELLGRDRRSPFAQARKEAMRQVRSLTWAAGRPPSYPQIGAWFERDHSTIVHACREVIRGNPHVAANDNYRLDSMERTIAP